VLNAVGFFKPAGGVKPPLLRNQFGFALGGPIIKDRTFFFVDYEGFRQISKALVFSALPTLTQRDGILTVDVRDPFSGTIYKARQNPDDPVRAQGAQRTCRRRSSTFRIQNDR